MARVPVSIPMTPSSSIGPSSHSSQPEVDPPWLSRWWPQARAALLHARSVYGGAFPVLGYVRYASTGPIIVPLRDDNEAYDWVDRMFRGGGYLFLAVDHPALDIDDRRRFWLGDL
jgi:hypothetical protein